MSEPDFLLVLLLGPSSLPSVCFFEVFFFEDFVFPDSESSDATDLFFLVDDLDFEDFLAVRFERETVRV